MNVGRLWLKTIFRELQIQHHRLFGTLADRPGFNSIKNVLQDHDRRLQISHLLRAILRECTYLPDSLSRKVIHAQCLRRFRSVSKRLGQGERSGIAEDSEVKFKRHLATAKDALRDLRRANAGHRNQLFRVLKMTYGRIGRRNYELLAPLKEANLEHSSQFDNDVSQITPQQTALMRSARQRRKRNLLKTPVKDLTPQIPETNEWGRPMPLKRVRNMKTRWYHDVLERTLVPLPSEQWERLRRLALGEEKDIQLPIKRRSGSKDNAGKESYSTRGRGFSRPRTITPRIMRRMYTVILESTPRLDQETTAEGELRWRARWRQRTCHGQLSRAWMSVAD